MSTTQRINIDLLRQLRAFSEATGVPVSRCVNDAVERWIQDEMPARLEALTLNNRYRVKQALGKIERVS